MGEMAMERGCDGAIGMLGNGLRGMVDEIDDKPDEEDTNYEENWGQCAGEEAGTVFGVMGRWEHWMDLLVAHVWRRAPARVMSYELGG
jgi:hypothetical protein